MAERSLYWSFLCYPDSCSCNIEDVPKILEEKGLKGFFVIHDRDNNEKGERKKIHAHTLLIFSSLKSNAQVCSLANGICANGQVILVHDVISMAKYLIHANVKDEDKHLYSVEDVISFGGVDYVEFIADKKESKSTIVREIISFCHKENITNFSDLVNISLENNSEWFEVIVNSTTVTIVLREYLRSQYFKRRE